jgi:uncharacterized membrane protein YraQ (UPF0718 family)
VFTEAGRHDFLQAGSYLVIGAAAAATLRVLVPPWVFQHVAGNLLIGVVTMALLAFVLALCSEADASSPRADHAPPCPGWCSWWSARLST